MHNFHSPDISMTIAMFQFDLWPGGHINFFLRVQMLGLIHMLTGGHYLGLLRSHLKCWSVDRLHDSLIPACSVHDLSMMSLSRWLLTLFLLNWTLSCLYFLSGIIRSVLLAWKVDDAMADLSSMWDLWTATIPFASKTDWGSDGQFSAGRPGSCGNYDWPSNWDGGALSFFNGAIIGVDMLLCFIKVSKSWTSKV